MPRHPYQKGDWKIWFSAPAIFFYVLVLNALIVYAAMRWDETHKYSVPLDHQAWPWEKPRR